MTLSAGTRVGPIARCTRKQKDFHRLSICHFFLMAPPLLRDWDCGNRGGNIPSLCFADCKCVRKWLLGFPLCPLTVGEMFTGAYAVCLV